MLGFHGQLFIWRLGIRTQVLRLLQQAPSYPLSHLPQPMFSVSRGKKGADPQKWLSLFGFVIFFFSLEKKIKKMLHGKEEAVLQMRRAPMPVTFSVLLLHAQCLTPPRPPNSSSRLKNSREPYSSMAVYTYEYPSKTIT